MRKATRTITRLYDAALEPAGITVVQFGQLRTIARLDRPTIGTLASTMALDRSATGRNVRVLARMGHVTLGPGEDERTREIRLTAKGRAAIGAAGELWQRVQAAIAERLGPERRALLLALLEDLGDPGDGTAPGAPEQEA